MNPNFPMTERRLTSIRAALRYRSLTLRELADAVCMCSERARDYIKYLHDRGEIRITGWPTCKVGRATRVAAYRIGQGPDASKPKRLTSAQRQAAHVARLRSDPDKYDRHKAIKRARRVPRARDPLVAALFGPARVTP